MVAFFDCYVQVAVVGRYSLELLVGFHEILDSFEGRIWDLIVSVPDHCLSFYFDRFDLGFNLKDQKL